MYEYVCLPVTLFHRYHQPNTEGREYRRVASSIYLGMPILTILTILEKCDISPLGTWSANTSCRFGQMGTKVKTKFPEQRFSGLTILLLDLNSSTALDQASWPQLIAKHDTISNYILNILNIPNKTSYIHRNRMRSNSSDRCPGRQLPCMMTKI